MPFLKFEYGTRRSNGLYWHWPYLSPAARPEGGASAQVTSTFGLKEGSAAAFRQELLQRCALRVCTSYTYIKILFPKEGKVLNQNGGAGSIVI